MNTEVTTEQGFVISRTLNAPRDLVWDVWTNAKHLKHWFGPKGVTIEHNQIDFRVGGRFHYSMRTPDGAEMWGRWVFEAIEPKDFIVWINSFSDPEGNVARVPFDGEWPMEMLAKATFDDLGEQTTVTVRWEPLNASPEEVAFFYEAHASMKQGWTGTFEQLETYLTQVTV